MKLIITNVMNEAKIIKYCVRGSAAWYQLRNWLQYWWYKSFSSSITAAILF